MILCDCSFGSQDRDNRDRRFVCRRHCLSLCVFRANIICYYVLRNFGVKYVSLFRYNRTDRIACCFMLLISSLSSYNTYFGRRENNNVIYYLYTGNLNTISQSGVKCLLKYCILLYLLCLFIFCLVNKFQCVLLNVHYLRYIPCITFFFFFFFYNPLSSLPFVSLSRTFRLTSSHSRTRYLATRCCVRDTVNQISHVPMLFVRRFRRDISRVCFLILIIACHLI